MTTSLSLPCCGYLTFEEPPGSYEICPVCFWEDDVVQLAFPRWRAAQTSAALVEGQRNFAAFGACERRLISHVRPPREGERRDAQWRPLDLDNDRHLRRQSRITIFGRRSRMSTFVCTTRLPDFWLNRQET